MKKTYCLVYQAGIANVFEENRIPDTRSDSGSSLERVRIKQADFVSCAHFCRGLKHAGAIVRVAWCNEAGDIINSNWHFFGFDRAPFCESFAKDLIGNAWD